MKNNGDNDLALAMDDSCPDPQPDVDALVAIFDEAEGLSSAGLFDQPAFDRLMERVRAAIPTKHAYFVAEQERELLGLLNSAGSR